MTLSRKTVSLIVTLVVIALSGLIVVQASLLSSAFVSKEQAFDRNVHAVLGSIVQKLTASEMIALAITRDTTTDSTKATASIITLGTPELLMDSLTERQHFIQIDCKDSVLPRMWVGDSSVHFCLPSTQHVELQAVNVISGERHVLLDTIKVAGDHVVPLTDSLFADGRYYFKFRSDSISIVLETEDGVTSGVFEQPVDNVKRQMIVASVLNQLGTEDQEPIEDRIDPQELDSMLVIGLKDVGLDLDYAFAVVIGDDDSLHLVNRTEYADQLRRSDLRASLFPQHFFSEPAELVIFFPERSAYLLRQMGTLVIPTVVLMVIIVACFAYTIRTIVRQRRVARLMVDFVNNMTHEFKTPISTVQLACEAIKRDDVISDRGKVRQFNDMILNESRRMKNQADKILQMAVLEEGDYELKIEDVDIHNLIAGAVDSIALHVENRHGSVECRLQAERHIIKADPVHLANVLQNLLDNANKYSPVEPCIRVTTYNQKGDLHVTISDNGLGIRPEDVKSVFDKYYRVPTGNLHDIKGFGLGLSYVKLMVEAHGGMASLESKPGEGTQVSLVFPASKLTE